MARVFISYAREDLVRVREAHRWLKQDGHQVLGSEDPHDGIAVDEQWRRQLDERLRRADAVVCVVTSAYLASTRCTAEVAIAQARGSRLLPLRAERDVVHSLLTELQHTDLVKNPDAART
ncbi:MAG: toll/interleukin-1 receptor domain-containing protein, partial [Pseudonocardiaceae bacterium]